MDAGYTAAQMGTVILEAEADEWDPLSAAPNKQARAQTLMRAMRGAQLDRANAAALELMRVVLNKGAPNETRPAGTIWYADLRATVEADGWEYDEERRELLPVVAGAVVASETTALERDLQGRNWTVAAGHYRQALDNYGAGNWASANAQFRSLLEELLPRAAEAASGSRPKEIQASLDQLRKHGVLVEGEYSLAKGLWDMSQPRGSHPGLSDRDEAAFRLLAVTSYSRFLLTRLP